MTDLLGIAINAVRASGTLVKKSFIDSSFSVKIKPDSSSQTTTDVDSEAQLLRCLTTAFPDHGFYSEESGQVQHRDASYQWFIDPLDGTENFILGIPYFSISLCLCENGLPIIAVVLNPVTDQLFTAVRGGGARVNDELITTSYTSELSQARVFIIPDHVTKHEVRTVRFRSALYERSKRVLDTWAPALDWCSVARGKAEGVFVIANDPILADGGMLAGMLILEEAKGLITDFHNQPVTRNNATCVVGSNASRVHTEFLELITNEFYGLQRIG